MGWESPSLTLTALKKVHNHLYNLLLYIIQSPAVSFFVSLMTHYIRFQFQPISLNIITPIIYKRKERKIYIYTYRTVWFVFLLYILKESVECKQGSSNGSNANKQGGKQGKIEEFFFSQVANHCYSSICYYSSHGPGFGR